jgi:hypothetical protein
VVVEVLEAGCSASGLEEGEEDEEEEEEEEEASVLDLDFAWRSSFMMVASRYPSGLRNFSGDVVAA